MGRFNIPKKGMRLISSTMNSQLNLRPSQAQFVHGEQILSMLTKYILQPETSFGIHSDHTQTTHQTNCGLLAGCQWNMESSPKPHRFTLGLPDAIQSTFVL